MSGEIVSQMWSVDAFTAESIDGFRKVGKITEGYQILADPGTAKLAISELAALPAMGAKHAANDDIRLRNRDFVRISPIHWQAIMTYQGEYPAIDGKPKVKWSNAESDEPIDVDYLGNPIMTVNGEPIDGVTRKINDLVATVERNYRSINLVTTHVYLDSVNSDTFMGFAPGVAKLTAFDATQAWDANDDGYWQVTARIMFRYPYNTTAAKAWYARIRHEGYIEKLGGKLVHAVDAFGQNVTRPVLLKVDGTRETNPASAYWHEWQRYGTAAYSGLGLFA